MLIIKISTIFLLLTYSQHSVGAVIVEDFSNSADASIIENADQISAISDGKLRLGMKSYNGGETVINPRLQLRLRDNSITALAATILINEISEASASSAAFLSFSGGFYSSLNTNEGLTGAVWTEMIIGDRGNGLEAWVEIIKSTNSDFSESEIVREDVILEAGEMSFETEYDVKLTYDGNSSFLASVNENSVTVDGPPFGSDVRLPKRVRTGLDLNPSDDLLSIKATSISVEIDNLFINQDTAVFDDFNDSELDTVKWRNSLGSSLVSDGKLTLIVNSEGNKKDVSISLTEQTNEMSGVVALLSNSTILDDVKGRIRLAGGWYNDTYNTASGDAFEGQIGKVYGQMNLRYFHGRFHASASMARGVNSDGTIYTDIFSEDFTSSFEFDVENRVSIKLIDKQMEFQLNDEVLTYNIESNIYPARYGNKEFLVRIQEGAGSVRATVDDIAYTPIISTDTDDEVTNVDSDSNSDTSESDSSSGGGSISPLLLISISLLLLIGIVGRRHSCKLHYSLRFSS